MRKRKEENGIDVMRGKGRLRYRDQGKKTKRIKRKRGRG